MLYTQSEVHSFVYSLAKARRQEFGISKFNLCCLLAYYFGGRERLHGHIRVRTPKLPGDQKMIVNKFNAALQVTTFQCKTSP